MGKHYYIVTTTTGDNVGEYQASDKKAALKELNDIYAPDGHKNVEVKLITKAEHDEHKPRIEQARADEANFVPEPEPEPEPEEQESE